MRHPVPFPERHFTRPPSLGRVYTKAPHRPPDRGPPYTLHRGQTVRDLGRLVHKALEQSLRFARVWGHAGYDGQQVGPDHPLADRDVVELHS